MEWTLLTFNEVGAKQKALKSMPADKFMELAREVKSYNLKNLGGDVFLLGLNR